MRLTLKLVDQRTKPSSYYNATSETEDYDRAEVELSGSARVIAGTLRTLADEIDPAKANTSPVTGTFDDRLTFAPGGVVR